MSNPTNLATESVQRHRAIMYHGKHSMRDMNLMMVGSTPLSQVTPKIVREEVACGDGDLDLSRVDGVLYFKSRTITYTFVQTFDESSDSAIRTKTKDLIDELSKIYKWFFQESGTYTVTRRDWEDNGSPTTYVGTVGPTDMYDSSYGNYKFLNASVTDIQVSKMMFHGDWVQSIEVTFTCDPYMQTFNGDRIELATFVDRSINNRNVQTAMNIYTNNRYWLNDFDAWFTNDCGVHVADNKWRFRVRVPYSGVIGFRLDPNPSMNGVHYEINTAYGQTTTLYFLDNSRPGETITSHKGGYGYTQTTVDTNGYKIIDFVVDFVQTWTSENPPWIYLEWGVMRNYTVPNQSNYIMEAYSKSNSAQMYVNNQETPTTSFPAQVILPMQPINEIHIRNTEYDGMYKFRFDTTTRRL